MPTTAPTPSFFHINSEAAAAAVLFLWPSRTKQTQFLLYPSNATHRYPNDTSLSLTLSLSGTLMRTHVHTHMHAFALSILLHDKLHVPEPRKTEKSRFRTKKNFEKLFVKNLDSIKKVFFFETSPIEKFRFKKILSFQI